MNRMVLGFWIGLGVLNASWVANSAGAPQADSAGAPRTHPDPNHPEAGHGPQTFVYIRDRLHSVQISTDFQDTSFLDVIDVLRRAGQFNLVVDPVLSETRPMSDMRVTLQLRDVTLADVMRLLLGFWDLRLVYRSGVAWLTTREEVNRDVTVRVYDIRDLTVVIRDFPAPEIQLAPPSTEFSGVVIDSDDDSESSNWTSDQIVELVRKNCGGSTWEDVPGTSITETGRLLVVSQSAEVHRDIARFLDLLRGSR